MKHTIENVFSNKVHRKMDEFLWCVAVMQMSVCVLLPNYLDILKLLKWTLIYHFWHVIIYNCSSKCVRVHSSVWVCVYKIHAVCVLNWNPQPKDENRFFCSIIHYLCWWCSKLNVSFWFWFFILMKFWNLFIFGMPRNTIPMCKLNLFRLTWLGLLLHLFLINN